MADRRPYASRGVPRRPTTGWAAARSRRWPRFLLGLLCGVLLLGVAVACVVAKPFALAPAAVDAPVAASRLTSTADAPTLPLLSQSANVSTPSTEDSNNPTAVVSLA